MRLRKWFVTAVLLYALAQFCERETDGFALTKVAREFLDVKGSDFDSAVLDQPYHYLAKGGQAYVFLSEDGNHVLKLFRSSRLSTLQMLHHILPLKTFKQGIQKQKALLRETLYSYHLAEQSLKEETGLIGVHLQSTNSPYPPLILIDKLQIRHKIDPNKYPFAIQKKATLVKETIQELLANNDLEGAKRAVRNLFLLLQTRVEKGIEDKDPNLGKNFGFCSMSPVQIDAGRFERSAPVSLEKIAHSKEDFNHWINQHAPELSEELDTAYEEFLHALL